LEAFRGAGRASHEVIGGAEANSKASASSHASFHVNDLHQTVPRTNYFDKRPLPKLKMEPVLPMLRMLPTLPILKMLPVLPTLRILPTLAILSKLPALSMPRILKTLSALSILPKLSRLLRLAIL
jgi:hypothetical protein